MMRTASKKSEERPPDSPSILPATERSWHGEPNVMMSTASMWPPWIFVMSPRWRICGSLLVVTLMGKGSISLAHAGLIPSLVAARGNPPEPSKSEPRVSSSILSFLLFFSYFVSSDSMRSDWNLCVPAASPECSFTTAAIMYQHWFACLR